MASIVVPRFFRLHGKAPAPLLTHSSTPARTLRLPAFAAFRASGTPDSGIGDAAGHVPGILRIRRPDVSPEVSGKEAEEESSAVQMEGGEEGEWVDWENQILEETVPLVGLVRMILHSGKYAVGDRLSVKHEEAILEKLLIYHPESKKKVGCGIDYITDFIQNSQNLVASSLSERMGNQWTSHIGSA
ncbi:Protein DCL, chloroplastic [Apostasia shenzhenica]|uniref:Protein DCL, chloroplastic n=1 Tax=Apostasia shenzhenica TaxID=1088818 RepID=A0A2I0AKL1_9ASPA|nr:Protein DCL, chloroplastic [Apostasia shenzhenica]